MRTIRHVSLAVAEALAAWSTLAACPLTLGGCGADAEPGSEPVASVSQPVEVCPHGSVIEGVDVSHWDGDIDWPQAHSQGIEFVIAKATEANNFQDDTFAANRQNAKAAGVAFGAFHFFRANVDATAQANYFLSTIGSVEPGEISPTIDVETADGESGATIAQGALTFLQVVQEQTGRVPFIYTSPSFFNDTLGGPDALAAYPLWLAHWGVSCPDVPSAWSDWTIWQYTDSGTVAGIPSAGDLDLDRIDITVEELQCVGVQCNSGTCVAGVCSGGSGGAGGAGGLGGQGTGGQGTGGAGAAGGQDLGGAAGSAGAAAGEITGEDSGCGCRTRPAPSRGSLLLGASVAALGLVRRKRR